MEHIQPYYNFNHLYYMEYLINLIYYNFTIYALIQPGSCDERA